MQTRTLEERQDKLNEFFPALRSNWAFLDRLLKHMDTVDPARARAMLPFKLYNGLADREPMDFNDIGKELGCDSSHVTHLYQYALRRLMNAVWWDESRWPKPG